MNLPTLEEYLKDFRERCIKMGNLEEIQIRVLKGECPFEGCNFEKDIIFRSMRRYYRHNFYTVKQTLLNIIDSVNEEVT